MDKFSVESEILAALPDDFLFQYELLWMRVFGRAVLGRRGGVEANVVSTARRVTRVSTNQTETRGAAKRNDAGGTGESDVVANEAALRMKKRVDRRLRLIARDIKVWLGDDVRAGVRRCSRCKRYAEDTWTYCPWDGARTEEEN